MKRRLTKGNEAIVQGAILAGCRTFFGYPITPASEIAEAAALWMPKLGGVFLQAESEIAAIQMAYGAASAGSRVLTASSGPGISLMQEGISYLSGAELPCVIVDTMRGGPGLGNIGPEQGDYFQMVKGGGHGNYRNIVLAPNCVQEMCDLTIRAFELADRYRNPAVVLADGVLAQMMEPIELPKSLASLPEKPWAVTGQAESRNNLITSIFLKHEDLEAHISHLEEKYRELEKQECDWEEYETANADILVVAYGITSRIAQSAVEMARKLGICAGMFRPITLYPFPWKRLYELGRKASGILVVELSSGQLLEDVRLAVAGQTPIRLLGRTGGMIPAAEEVFTYLNKMEMEYAANHA